jgi:hypothetical protein
MCKLLLLVQCEYENLNRGDDLICFPQIVMAELEGTKTVVVGGKKDVKQQYCGTVGGQSTDFATIDSEIKACSNLTLPMNGCNGTALDLLCAFLCSLQTAGLKNNTLAPPDL